MTLHVYNLRKKNMLKVKKTPSNLQRKQIDMLCLSNILTYKTNIGYWYAKKNFCV